MSRWWDDSSTLVNDTPSPPVSSDDLHRPHPTTSSAQPPPPPPRRPPPPPERPSHPPERPGAAPERPSAAPERPSAPERPASHPPERPSAPPERPSHPPDRPGVLPTEKRSISPSPSGSSKHPHLSSSSASSSSHHKHHGIFSKKSKAAKGLSFLIKASKETAKRRSKSPTKSPSKSPSRENFAEDFEPVDDEVKAKSEQWQAFLQMQDRIKLNVLKTQQSIGKLAAGRISPSGRISPAKRDPLKADDEVEGDGEDNEAAPSPWTGQDREEEGEEEEVERLTGPWGTGDSESKLLSQDGQFSSKDGGEFSLRASDRKLPHLSVTSARSLPMQPGRDEKEEEEEEVDLLGCSVKPVPPSTPVDPEIEAEVADLLGLGAEEPDTSAPHQPAPAPFLVNEDLLGLEDFLGSGPSADPRGVEGMDWYMGSSTTYSSSQSSLSSSPVAFDIDFFLEQERFATDSTAVSDLARTLVDDFLQWGAEAEKEDNGGSSVVHEVKPLSSSTNPFLVHVPAPSAAASKSSSFGNPFATTTTTSANHSDETDTAFGFAQRDQTSASDTAGGFDAFNPFGTGVPVSSGARDSGASVDAFGVNVTSSLVTESGAGLDPFRTTDAVSATSVVPFDPSVGFDPFASATVASAASSESTFNTDPFATIAYSASQVSSDSRVSVDPFGVEIAVSDTSQISSGGRDNLDPFGSTTVVPADSDMSTISMDNVDLFSSTTVASVASEISSGSKGNFDPFGSATVVSTASKISSEIRDNMDPFGFLSNDISTASSVPVAYSADPFGMDVVTGASDSSMKVDPFGCTTVTSVTTEFATFTTDPFGQVTDAPSTSDVPPDSSEHLDPFGSAFSAPSEVHTLDLNANARVGQAGSSTTTESSSTIDVTDSTSDPWRNPFLEEPVAEQPSESAPFFDDDFFSSKLSATGKVAQDTDIWGTGVHDTTSSSQVFNPFESDLFVGTNNSATGTEEIGALGTDIPTIKSEDGGEITGTGFMKPINPFLTASFENISINSVPATDVHQLFLASTDELDKIGTEPSSPPAESSDAFDPFGDSADGQSSSQPETVQTGDQKQTEGQQILIGDDDKTEEDHQDDDDDKNTGFKLLIKAEPIKGDHTAAVPVPVLPPPPKRPKSPPVSNRENPFDKESPPEENFASFEVMEEKPKEVVEPRGVLKSMSSESSTFTDEDNLEPLEPFIPVMTRGYWKLMMRHPIKKKLGGNRYWKTVFCKIDPLKDGPMIRVYDKEKCEGEVLQELPLQPCYSMSELTAQQFDQYGKIHTVKFQYVFYRERVGIKPDRITPSFVKKPKATMVLDHAPQVSELLKFGCLDKEEIRSFIAHMEDSFMTLDVRREKTLTYTKDEIQAEVWDEYNAVIDKEGHTSSQKARVRVFILAFLTGMPACELGINDKTREGKEVVGRHDIIPVRTEDWIRIESPEFHSVVDLDTYENTNNLRFHPLDACQFELLRFRVRPRENRELPLQIRAQQILKERHFELRCDMLVTGYHAFSKKCGQFPCEDIEVRFKIPETWIYYFRYERKFRYGSLKAIARKPGKIRGLERLTMMAQGLLSPALMEASVGSAKYEHLHRSVVWRVPRLPERNQGAYKNHLFVLRLDLGPHDEIPDSFAEWFEVEFNTPASTVSKTQVRSISVENPDPPEKWVRYVAKYQYRVQMDNKLDTASDVVHEEDQ